MKNLNRIVIKGVNLAFGPRPEKGTTTKYAYIIDANQITYKHWEATDEEIFVEAKDIVIDTNKELFKKLSDASLNVNLPFDFGFDDVAKYEVSISFSDESFILSGDLVDPLGLLSADLLKFSTILEELLGELPLPEVLKASKLTKEDFDEFKEYQKELNK